VPQINTKFQQINIAPSIDAMSYFVGVHDNGDGTYSDYRFTSTQIATFFSGAGPLITAGSGGYTIGGGGTTLTGSYFTNTISEIATNLQTYLLGADFTQTSTTITLLNGMTFNTGQILRAKI
jgi:hypothetical protein